MSRTPLIAGNWKMHKTIPEALGFVRELLALGPDCRSADAVVCPAFTALAAVRDARAGSPVALGAQTMWYAESGAFTGEVSPLMLRDCGVTWVVLGHSERREFCGEIDDTINRKIAAALKHGITPIVAVGETADEHAAGFTRDRVVTQIRGAFAGIPMGDVARSVVAYEPLWAIGSGQSDSPEGANAVMGEIRAAVAGLADVRILYGGSVKPENVGSFVAQPNIDGALVGGASLDPRSFAALLANAAEAAR
jgi:triosephosphate isomerase (TIM)